MMKALLVNRWIHTGLLLLLLIASLSLREKDYHWIKSLRYQAFDFYNQMYPRKSNDKVVVVDIDEESLRDDKLGQWPSQRTDVAKLVAHLKSLGAKAIVFDMVFAEEDRTSPSVILRKLPEGRIDNTLIETLRHIPDHDTELARVMADAGNVVTGFVWTSSADATRHIPFLSKSFVMGKGSEILVPHLFSAAGVTTNLPILEKSAAGNGSFGQIPDIDGLIRRVPLLFRVDNDVYPSLALEALRVAEDPKTPNKIRPLKENELTAFSFPFFLKRGQHTIPMDADALFYVHYSPFDEGKYIPAWTIMEETVDPARIRDKIVLVGTSAAGLKDIRSTPLDLYIPGVDVHRNIIEQIIEGRYLLRPSLMKAAEMIFTGIVALFVIFLAPFVNALALGGVSLLVISAVNFISLGAYSLEGILIDPIYPSLTILILFFLSSLLAYIRTEMDRRSIKQAFGYYISPDYMTELTQDPSRLRLGGEIRPVTVMFTDIRGFTGISEKLEPNELIQLMNDFLTPMSDEVMAHRGTIDKYMGDAMMAFWNAPLDDAEHERNACHAALSMKKALDPVNAVLIEKAKRNGVSPLLLRAGIGINSGPAAVGNMGSRQRFAYSVLGDTVNLASRLESQTKTYGVDILIGENTAACIPDFALLQLDVLRVKGKETPVRIYTILDTEKSDSFKGAETLHNKMFEAYQRGDWDLAMTAIVECQTEGEKALSFYYTMMRDRIEHLKSENQTKPWDGVFTAIDK